MDSRTKKKLLLYGAGGHGAVVADAVSSQGDYMLVGFIDDNPSRIRDVSEDVTGGPGVVATGATIHRLTGGEVHWVIVSIGNNKTRETKALEMVQSGLRLATVIHSHATVARSASIGEGTVVLAGAVINSRAVIGRNVIVNTAATVDHDCVIGDGVHLSPGVRLAGGVSVGPGSHLGIGAVVIENIEVKSGAIVGAGAVVVRPIPENTTVIGNPAREMKNRPSANVSPDVSIRKTLEVIDRGGMSIALVIDQDGRLRGAVTDGDVRRGILHGVSLDDAVSSIMNRDPVAVKLGTSTQEMRGIMLQNDIKQIPVIGENGQFLHIVMYADTIDK